MSAPPTLGQIVEVLERRYDPRWAESWDAVGLTCGDPVNPVERVLFAVDPVAATVEEAIDVGADLLVTHHPLYLRPVHSVAATTAKGRLVHRLVSNGAALFTAHTNADAADPGVSDALAETLGLTDLRPLAAQPADPLDKLVVFVPDSHAEQLVDALAAAGAGAIGAYERCAWTTTGIGTFRPLSGASPTIGSVGAIEAVPEVRVEMVLPRWRRIDVVQALLATHPYEEPAYDVYELASHPGSRGIGRIGTLDSPEPLSRFVHRAAAALPPTAAGVRASGDPGRIIRTVAVCGGAGDSLLAAARDANVDVYLTADLRHHPASESGEDGGPALVDVSHWASEWPWLRQAEAALLGGLTKLGTTVETRVSTTRTDPWTLHGRSEGSTP